MGPKAEKLIIFLRERGGVTTYSDIIQAGFHKETLFALINKGDVERVGRALYRLREAPALPNPDLVTAALKIPKGVVCLLSALAYHEATDEVPRCVDLAIPRGAHANKLDYPPIRIYRFAQEAWKAGIEQHKIDSYSICVYGLAKTVADCFKFRNKIGLDVARNALKQAVTEKRVPPKEIIRYAKICRVDKIIKPILETLI